MQVSGDWASWLHVGTFMSCDSVSPLSSVRVSDPSLRCWQMSFVATSGHSFLQSRLRCRREVADLLFTPFFYGPLAAPLFAIFSHTHTPSHAHTHTHFWGK